VAIEDYKILLRVTKFISKKGLMCCRFLFMYIPILEWFCL